jgi:hypothetical protein
VFTRPELCGAKAAATLKIVTRTTANFMVTTCEQRNNETRNGSRKKQRKFTPQRLATKDSFKIKKIGEE